METQMLPVALTDQEWIQRGKALARVTVDLDALAERRKRLVAETKAQEAALRAQGIEHRCCVEHGTELRPVEVAHVIGYATGQRYTVRRDTLEIASARPLNAAEQQTDLLAAPPPEWAWCVVEVAHPEEGRYRHAREAQQEMQTAARAAAVSDVLDAARRRASENSDPETGEVRP